MPEKPKKFLPALYGGIIMGAISGLPFLSLVNCCCCAGVMFGGLMSVFFYKKDLTASMPPLSSTDALQLGALAGVFGAIVGTLLNGLTLASVGNVGGETAMEILRSLGDQIPPEVLDQIESRLKDSGTFTGLALITQFFWSIIVDPLFGLIGGLIGYSVFKPKQAPLSPQPPAAPPVQS